MSARELADLDAEVSTCRACPRLVAWRERVAAEKRAAFRDQEYWGRPVPGFGDAGARILILGLAPAAHGGNRTGRIFTGDRSGDVLFDSLYRVGFANQPTSVSREDGLRLREVRMSAAVRCAPPENKPTPVERDTCSAWMVHEVTLIKPTPRAFVALGAFAWDAWWPVYSAVYGMQVPRPRPKFGHGAVWASSGAPRLIDITHLPGTPPVVVGCYHPSQQNTFTGRLTPAMLDDVFALVKQEAGLT